jgi:hypothetical protein
VQKIVPLLFRFDAAVQTTLCVFHRLREGNSLDHRSRWSHRKRTAAEHALAGSPS